MGVEDQVLVPSDTKNVYSHKQHAQFLGLHWFGGASLSETAF